MMDIESMTDEELDDLIVNPRSYLRLIEEIDADVRSICRAQRKVEEEMEHMRKQLGDLNMRLYRNVGTLKLFIAKQKQS